MDKKTIRQQKFQRQQELVNAAKAENRAMTAEETAEFQRLQGEIETLTREIESENATPAAAPTAPATPDNGNEQTRAIEAERARIREITNLCRTFDMDPQSYIDNGSTMDEVRQAVIEQMSRAHAPVSTRVTVTATGEDDFRRDASDALMLRSGRVEVQNPSNGARQLAAMSLRDLGIECLSREGSRGVGELLRKSPDDLYSELSRQFYNPTAAFPSILDQTIRKSIVELYNKVPTTFQEFTTKGTLKDFKATADHEYVIGGLGDFLLVPENGEIKPDKPRTELLPQRKLDTYGKQFSMSRQAFINDDIGFLTEVPGLYATAAKKTIDKQVYSLLFNGKSQTIFDGYALFDQNSHHYNLAATDAAPTATAIQKMILLMQKQTDQFGDAIYMTPGTLVVGMGYEFDLAVIFRSAQVVGSDHNDVNPLYNYPLKVVQSPLLNAMTTSGQKTPWFMIADPSSARGIQVDYLNGQETPTIRRMETAGQLGFVWVIYLDWGISVRDFRGLYRNDGAVIS